MTIKKILLYWFFLVMVGFISYLLLNAFEFRKIGPENRVISFFADSQKKATILANNPVIVHLRSDKIFQAKIDGIPYISEQEQIGTYHIPYINGNIKEIEILDNHASVSFEVSSENEKIQVWISNPLFFSFFLFSLIVLVCILIYSFKF